MTAATPTVKPVGNVCRWLTPSPRTILLQGDQAPLYIAVQTTRGVVEQYYWVSQIRCPQSSQCLGYSLRKDVNGMPSVSGYNIDLTMGCTRPDQWVCDCASMTYRDGAPCKHVKALAAALDRIGLLTVN